MANIIVVQSAVKQNFRDKTVIKMAKKKRIYRDKNLEKQRLAEEKMTPTEYWHNKINDYFVNNSSVIIDFHGKYDNERYSCNDLPHLSI